MFVQGDGGEGAGLSGTRGLRGDDMTDVKPIRSAALEHPAARHAFFTRRGGVSEGVYATLNGGVGSRDAPDRVAENRGRMARALGVAADRLLVPYQIHSPTALAVEAPWIDADRPRCDALTTRTPGLALAVTGADCGMILFHDAVGGVIGAAHAGWKGALGGVLEATIDSMEGLGARREDMRAALGPTIALASYEVGPEFYRTFLAEDPTSGDCFRWTEGAERPHFDLPAYIGRRLERAGVGAFDAPALDTYADEARFYSYRRSQHRGEPDYGRLISAIALA
jgi:YfiH family protein